MTAPRENLMWQSDVVTVNSGGILLGVWPTGGAGDSRESRLVAEVGRAEDVDLDGTEHLDLVMPDVHAA